MASIDVHTYSGPRQDRLGVSLFVLHIVVSGYVLGGWLVPEPRALAFYLLLLPTIALQWRFNEGSCIINNMETWLRTGRWRDSSNREEAGFLLMLSAWMLGARPSRAFLDRISYALVGMLWTLGAVHAWLFV